MNKQQFISSLRARLSSLPGADINRYVDYYSEMIDDRIEDGLSEEEAVSDLGSIDSIVSQIFAEAPKSPNYTYSPAPNQPGKKEKSKISPVWIIILIVITSPFWLSAIASSASVILGIAIVFVSIIPVLYAVDLVFAVSGIICFIGSFVPLFTLDLAVSAFIFGCGLMFAGGAVLLFFAATWVAKNEINFFKWIYKKVEKLFDKRGAAV